MLGGLPTLHINPQGKADHARGASRQSDGRQHGCQLTGNPGPDLRYAYREIAMMTRVKSWTIHTWIGGDETFLTKTTCVYQVDDPSASMPHPIVDQIASKECLNSLAIRVLGLAIAYYIGRALYNVSPLHPLSHIPGPKLAAMTILYEFWFDFVKFGRFSMEIKRMHDVYGSFMTPDPSSDLLSAKSCQDLLSESVRTRFTAVTQTWSTRSTPAAVGGARNQPTGAAPSPDPWQTRS